MALHLHLGSAGSGKTTGLHQRILKEASTDKQRSFLIVVPEQFTLQTQREIIEKSDNHGMMNIDVLSFARMSHRVFEELGITMLPILEDTGKGMIVKKVAIENKEKLSVYRGKVSNRGFIEEMKSLIAEFYQYGIGADEIEKMLELASDRKNLSSKLTDISILYNAFADFIDGRFCMNEEITDRLCEVAAESKLLKDSVIAFDCFTGFTPSQYNCIRMLLGMCKDVHVALTIDLKELEKATDEASLFHLSAKTILKLEKQANELGVNVIKHTYASEQGRFSQSPALRHIEENIFRYPYTQGTNDGAIRLLSCDTKEQEVAYAIARIRELVFEEGYRYQDIAIVTGDVGAYSGIISREALKADIPLFIDEKKSIRNTSAVEFILSALEIIRSDFAYESVFRFLKAGYVEISADDISRLENYCIRFGIKGYNRWKKEWKVSAKNNDISEENLAKINSARAYFVELMSKLYEAEGISKAEKAAPTVRERIALLYGILDQCKVEEKLYYKAEALGKSESVKDRIAGKEKSQLFRSIIDVFNRIDGLLAGDSMPLKEFTDVLDTGFNEAKVRNIPGGADSIVLGDIERTRLSNKKVIFLLGVNDNVIPKQSGAGGILSDYDRSLFEEHDIELSPTKKENAYLSEFYLYLALTRPSEKLFMSFARMGEDDKEGRPAYIIGRLQKLFYNLKITDYSEIDKTNPYVILGSDKGLSAVTAALRTNSERPMDDSEKIILSLWEQENEKLAKLLRSAAKRRNTKQSIGEETAEKLYGECIRGSITRLQNFAECAFLHFLKYGIGIKERDEYQLSGLEIGNIYHTALEKYGKLVEAQKKSWRDVAGEERVALEEKAIEQALAEYLDIVESSKRNEYFKNRLKRVLSRTVDMITEQISAGSFEVKYLEQSFEHSNRFLSLRGKIDRVDVAEKNGKTYVRVIDYKSGKQSFDLNKLYYGLQLQLVVYLRECGVNAENAGMYYLKVDDPLIDATKSGFDISKLEELRKKAFVLDGLSVSNPDILELSDSNLASDGELIEGGKSLVLGLGTKKGEKLPKGVNINDLSPEESAQYKTSLDRYALRKVVSAEKMAYLTEFAAQKTTEMTMQIKSGMADINPYLYQNNSPCTYCAYKSICSFDSKLGDEYRELEKDAADKYLWENASKTEKEEA